MDLLDRFTNATQFKDYKDFYHNFRLRVPEGFNFAYDVVDEYARLAPEKRALVWCDDLNEERTFTFADIKRLSDKTANFFLSLGIGKGDAVLVILQRRWEYWTTLMALSKIGAVAIPATHMLMEKDLVYRMEKANVRMVVAAGERSAAAARFFCTLRGAFCIVLPLSPTARGLFCRESTEGNYPVKEPDAVLFDEQIARADRALALAETALCAVLADDTDIDAAFTGERREKGYSFLRTAESLCESAASPREIFAASTVYHLALREFSAYPAFIFARLTKERFSLSEGAAAFHALRFFAARHVLLFSAGKLRPYFVADYPARLERAAKAAEKEAFSALRIPTAEECFSRAGIFSECREHFALAAGLTAHFVQSVSERYFLFGGAKEQFFAEGTEELYELAADLSPLYSVGAIERDFGAAPARRARAAGSIDAKRAFSSPSLSAERTGARDLFETDARSGSERAIG